MWMESASHSSDQQRGYEKRDCVQAERCGGRDSEQEGGENRRSCFSSSLSGCGEITVCPYERILVDEVGNDRKVGRPVELGGDCQAQCDGVEQRNRGDVERDENERSHCKC